MSDAEPIGSFDRDYLRSLLAEDIPEGGGEEHTRFATSEIDNILSNTSSFVEAAAIGWAIKAAKFSNAVNINESGSDRRLNQLFKNAESMRDYYADLAKVDAESVDSAMRRMGSIGRSAPWGEHAGLKGSIDAQVKEATTTRMSPGGGRWFPSIKK